MISLKKLKLFGAFILLPAAAFCQEEAAVDNFSYFSNALFLALLVTIILLAILIVAFSSAFKNIADSDYLINKYQKDTGKGSDVTKQILSVVLLLSSLSMLGQDGSVAPAVDDWRIGGMDQFTFYFMLAIILTEVIILALMFYQFNFLVRTARALSATPQKKKESKIILTLTDAVAIEEEERILLDHDYDGIKELDNNLPPWWKYGFYLTIVFACIYLLNYHVLGTGDLQGKEYEKDIAQAKREVDEYMKKSANNVDETTVKYLTEASDLAAGKDIFVSNCAACHGKLGEGSVGPNLTDAYWLHGGSIQDIFKSVKYGWVEKGMKSWKEDFSPVQIAQLTSFIKSLKGTNPANPKAPQGDLFNEAVTPVTDSTAVIKDSLAVSVDSLDTKK
jgi:cytochrome c oxidase cbb3-type subunit 3